MSETDKEFLDRYWEYLNWDTEDPDFDRLFALARRGADAADEIERLRAALREIIQSAERSARNVAFRKRINFYATPLNEAWDGGALETHNILADIALAALGGGDE